MFNRGTSQAGRQPSYTHQESAPNPDRRKRCRSKSPVRYSRRSRPGIKNDRDSRRKARALAPSADAASRTLRRMLASFWPSAPEGVDGRRGCGFGGDRWGGWSSSVGVLAAIPQGQHARVVVVDHVAVVGAVGHLHQADRAGDLVGGLVERPAAVLGPVGDLGHRGPVQAVVAMEEDRDSWRGRRAPPRRHPAGRRGSWDWPASR